MTHNYTSIEDLLLATLTPFPGSAWASAKPSTPPWRLGGC